MTVQTLQFAIDSLSLQQKQTANNITNDQTPDYTASEVSFEQSLVQALESPNGGTAVASLVVSTQPYGTDGNNVNLTQELMRADRTTLQYQATVAALNYKFRLIKGVTGNGFT